jgi:Na+-driven multidrug efflux pump
MTRRLLSLAGPLGILFVLPASQVFLDRQFLGGEGCGAISVATHALLLAAASLLFLFLNGANVYAVVALAKLLDRRRLPADAAAVLGSTIGVATWNGLLCLLLLPFVDSLAAPLIGHPLDADELAFARYLLVTVAILLFQNAALAPTLARKGVWLAAAVGATSVAVHAILLLIVLPDGGLGATAIARAGGAFVSASLALALLPFPKWCGLFPVVWPTRATIRELVTRGAVIGIQGVIGNLFVGVLFFLALAQSSEQGLVAAAAMAFAWSSLFAAIPLAIGQATGILTAEALGRGEVSLVHDIVKHGDRVCFPVSFLIGTGLHFAGSVMLGVSWFTGHATYLAGAFFGVSLHTAFDGTIQTHIWSLRALTRQNQILAATVATGAAYAVLLFLYPGPNACWCMLGAYDIVLWLILQRVLARSLPALPPVEERLSVVVPATRQQFRC